MYCKSCGREIGDAKFCPICGTEQSGDSGDLSLYGSESIDDKYRTAFSDPMFFAITVIMTVVAILSVFVGNRSLVRFTDSGAGFTLSITAAVFPILFAIALWIIFASVRGQGRISTTGFAMASGILKALRIIIWIIMVVFIIFAVLLIIAGNYVVNQLDVSLPDFLNELGIELKSNVPIGHPDPISGLGMTVVIVVGMILLIVIIIVNVVYLKKLHRFAKSVCVSLKTGTPDFRCVRGAKNWLIVTAVFSFLGAAGSLTSFRGSLYALSLISALLSGIASILASMMVKKYFLNDYTY